MAIRRMAVVLMGAAALTVVASSVAGAQMSRAGTPVLVTKDDSSKQVTITAPSLQGSMPNVAFGLMTVFLKNVVVEPFSGNGVRVGFMPNGNSYAQLSGSPAAGKYHVRFNYAWVPVSGSSAPTSAHVTIHSGQLTSDPAVASCTLSSAVLHCDTVLNLASRAGFYLTAVVDGGAYMYFGNVYMAPTQ